MIGAAPQDGSDQAEIRFLVEKNADGIIVVDENGMVLFANPASAVIFGRDREALIGSPIGVPLVTGETTEIAIHRPGGSQIDAEIRVVDTNWARRPAKVASIRDISSRKVVEEQLRHASKMEAIGRLTAGIAHDFNNLLTIVMGNLEMAQRQAERGPVVRLLDNAMRGARRAAGLTERLLAFARRKPLEPKLLDANDLVAGMTDLLRRTLGEAIEIRTRLADQLGLIEADPTELETAIVNLAVNSRDAMPAGGELVIETADVELDEASLPKDAEVNSGAYVLISITDTGTGMPSDVLRQVFEPFFTTKTDGRGTGLGLSQVYGFVKQSGGHVNLYSEPGRGTAAKIYLPRSDGRIAPQQGADTGLRDEAIPGAAAGEVVLVVEDNEDVRTYTAAGLRNLGYGVFEAADAAAALELLRHEPSIRLLLTDLGLPGGVDGKELALRAQAMRRDMQVLITTAYAGNALVHEGRLDQGIDLLSKPFTLTALAKKVRLTLDRYEAPAEERHILVVEDELFLRMMVVEVLSGDGYRTAEASTFAQAMEKLPTVGDKLCGAVLDLGLPDQPGDRLVSKIRAIKPDIPIILITGFADRNAIERFSPDRKIKTLIKPFDLHHLLAVLRRLEG